MRKLSRLPSSHFPDYLKLDLGVGLEEAHPIACALDEVALALSQLGIAAAFRMQPALLPAAELRKQLGALGFTTSVLEDEEVYALFDRRELILGDPGSLDALRTLAEIFLGTREVRRGRPIAPQPLAEGGVRSLRLQDTQGDGETIFVRCAAPVTATRRDAFCASLRRLLPWGVDVEVAAPLASRVPLESGYNLRGPLKLAERRL